MTPKEKRRRLFDVADMIENNRLPGIVYDQSVFFNHLNDGTTACCIAGFVLVAAYGSEAAWRNRQARGAFVTSGMEAARILGLTNGEQKRLLSSDKNRPTRARAVRVLRHFAQTGEIDWNWR